MMSQYPTVAFAKGQRCGPAAGRRVAHAAGHTMAWFWLAIISCSGAHALGVAETEHASAWKYSGWACNPAVPGYQTEVQARRDDGEFLGRVIADRPRDSASISACSSPHGMHGFELAVAKKDQWADGKMHDVTLYSVDRLGEATPFHTFSTMFAAAPAGNVEPPSIPGDIVGRDLDFPLVRGLGHLGIWDGREVIEILNEGNDSKVFRKSWEDFKSRSPVWNTAHPRYPGHTVKTCWNKACDVNSNRPGETRVSAPMAVVSRAQQVYLIGADYSYTIDFTTAEPELTDYTQPGWRRRSVRGRYRSDAFIYDAFRSSTDLENAGIFPYRQVFNMPDSWRAKISGMYHFAAVLPYKMMEKIRGF